MFRICAAAATPWAWLPDENATTPPLREPNGIDDSLLKAPRNLNDPVRCSISGFRNTFVPARSLSTGNDNNGVRTANGATTRAAASISAASTAAWLAGSVILPLYRAGQGAGKTLSCEVRRRNAGLPPRIRRLRPLDRSGERSGRGRQKRARKLPRYAPWQIQYSCAARFAALPGTQSPDPRQVRRATPHRSRRGDR